MIRELWCDFCERWGDHATIECSYLFREEANVYAATGDEKTARFLGSGIAGRRRRWRFW